MLEYLLAFTDVKWEQRIVLSETDDYWLDLYVDRSNLFQGTRDDRDGQRWLFEVNCVMSVARCGTLILVRTITGV